jgi:hypothetical protein
MTGTMADPACESRNRHSAALAREAASVAPDHAREKSDIRDGAKRLERDQQKWIPVLRPIALLKILRMRMIFSPNAHTLADHALESTSRADRTRH